MNNEGVVIVGNSIDESETLTVSPTADYTTLIRCVCGDEVELY